MKGMTLEEAIKLNSELLRTGNYDVEPKFAKAIGLGIEALKRVKANRKGPIVIVYKELPGETEE